ncbi:MAG: 30S ribosomal protein S19e [Candidatus Altiarchaeales archaeon]|nr:30S ribosomal protein S19e [Candidatus Altiarchaeales archaeon]MBD3415723.1 30S ribosomal protein S19e [Candidatus Altiarchaeales archaeon]
MATVYDVPADELIRETAADLKENVKLERPEWALFVKTGTNKGRKPDSMDWWWTRAASLLRRIYVQGPVGVQRLRSYYGGKKNRGRKKGEFRRSSGKVLRSILKQLDEAGLTESGAKGRKITSKGQSYLDKISSKISQ